MKFWRLPCSYFARCFAIGSILVVASSLSADVVTFRDGLNGYTATVDTTLFQSQPTNNNNTSANGFIGLQNSGQNQFLIRFDDIFGSGTNQIPVGATINSATLSFTRGPSGGFTSDARLYDLTISFNAATATWDSLINGITVGSETDATQTGATGTISSATTTLAPTTFNVLSSLTEWSASPSSNLGWMLHAPASTQNVNIRSSDATDDLLGRPTLTVDFTAVPEPTSMALCAMSFLGFVFRRSRRSEKRG